MYVTGHHVASKLGSMDELPGYWRENIRRSLQDWEGKEGMVGILLILLTAFGYGWWAAQPTVAKWSAIAAVAYVAVLVFVASPWQMWRDSQRAIADYRERLKPQIRFVFEPDVPPYLHHFTLRESGRVDRRVRLWRVGLINDSSVVIKDVRVVVESLAYEKGGVTFERLPEHPPIEHALNIMGFDTKTGNVDLSPGDRPTVYIDVVQQLKSEKSDPEKWISLCYATGHRVQMFARDRWLIGLRAEGGGTYCRARFAVESSVEQKDITMRSYGLY